MVCGVVMREVEFIPPSPPCNVGGIVVREVGFIPPLPPVVCGVVVRRLHVRLM